MVRSLNSAGQRRQCNHVLSISLRAGDLEPLGEAELEKHLTECKDCRRLLDESCDRQLVNKVEQYLAPDAFEEGQFDDSTASSILDSAIVDHVLEQLAPTDDPNSLGRIGGYEVTGVVGAGGMGLVLKAHDPTLDRVVAIKVMAPQLASIGAARQRFAREARSAASVLHPNVVAIHGVSNDSNLPYIVMPFIRGSSLQNRIDQIGPLSIPEILRIGAQLAAGLAAAHRQGLVHRDVKPANILLEEGVERVSITDFGLARAVDDATMTQSGLIVGTPQYMSPEQARGEAIDERSDLFSLGSVMYAMCTGHPPFHASSSIAVALRLTSDTPRRIREINPSIPKWLVRLIQILQEKKVANRLPTAELAEHLLSECLKHVEQPDQHQIPALLTARAPKRKNLLMASLVLGLFSIACLAFWLLNLRETQVLGTSRQLVADPLSAVSSQPTFPALETVSNEVETEEDTVPSSGSESEQISLESVAHFRSLGTKASPQFHASQPTDPTLQSLHKRLQRLQEFEEIESLFSLQETLR
ncbi:MAG TPA: serine/threonine protein kinase [Planctomycetaceae bacterium]|nr:serine/threonine protein kinase [Planctomycetaceae bacterium]